MLVLVTDNSRQDVELHGRSKPTVNDILFQVEGVVRFGKRALDQT